LRASRPAILQCEELSREECGSRLSVELDVLPVSPSIAESLGNGDSKP
jgi:hypothetical protein